MISPTMRRALEIFAEGRRTVQQFGDEFWSTGHVRPLAFAPGTDNYQMARQTIDKLVEADVLHAHYKGHDHYDLTTRGKALLAESQAADQDGERPLPKPWKLRN